MKVLGIDFVPLDEPMERRLQALAAGAWFITCTFLGALSLILLIYLFFTPLWWLSLSYLCFIYFDRNSCEKGGRASKWVRNWAWWRYMKDYFPSCLKLVPDFELQPNRNYLFCCFPHGVFPAGPFSAIASEAGDFHQIYPDFKVKSTILRQFFWQPVTREIGLGFGAISCSSQSLYYVLTRPGGGYIVNLFPGGAAEAVHAKPGKYKFVVKKRKGFVKIALKTGAPLVPVITFGEVDLFDQIQVPIVRRFQEFVKKMLGFIPILLIGNGLLQYTFGVIPRRRLLTTVVGIPINVERVQNPSKEQIDELHEQFVEELVKLFEKYKFDYLEDPEDKILELE